MTTSKRFAIATGLFLTAVAGSAVAGEPDEPASAAPPPAAPDAAAADSAATAPAAPQVAAVDPTPEVAAPAAPAAAPAVVAAAPPPYSLAWQLRPAAAASVVRSDTTVAAYDAGDAGSGTTVASTMLASYKVTPELAPLIRFAVAHNNPPAGEGGTTVSNPLLGVTYARPLAPAIKLAVFGGLTLPVGTGGGDSPDAAVVAANKAAMAARSAMDNALFAVNHMTPIVGGDIAYVANGFTVQAEATLLQLIRVRGNDMTAPDEAITNFTSGIHAGYFVMPWLSIGGEVRYQRYLSTPAVVDAVPAARDNLSTAIGVRGHIKLGGKRWLRPGIAYARGIDDPMSKASYHVVQIDVPLAF